MFPVNARALIKYSLNDNLAYYQLDREFLGELLISAYKPAQANKWSESISKLMSHNGPNKEAATSLFGGSGLASWLGRNSPRIHREKVVKKCGSFLSITLSFYFDKNLFWEQNQLALTMSDKRWLTRAVKNKAVRVAYGFPLFFFMSSLMPSLAT